MKNSYNIKLNRTEHRCCGTSNGSAQQSLQLPDQMFNPKDSSITAQLERSIMLPHISVTLVLGFPGFVVSI